MVLGTFGAALKFGMDLERQVNKISIEAAQQMKDDQIRAAFQNLAIVSGKHYKILQVLYAENSFSDMDAGIFEPITTLNEIDYFFPIETKQGMGSRDLVTIALHLEENIARFYDDLVIQFRFRHGVARKLKTMASESVEQKENLVQLKSVAS